MALSKDIGPYVFNPHQGSILETTTILSSILRPAGYSRDTVQTLAVNAFLENERNNIRSPATMHLLGLKKALLYAIPVISIPTGTSGITLTSQVVSPAIQYDHKHNKVTPASLTIGDKFRLIGLAFPQKLVNHLSYSIFPWKYFNPPPLYYHPAAIDVSYLVGIETKATRLGPIYLIKSKHYEDAALFNEINRLIAYKLNEPMTSILSIVQLGTKTTLPQIERIEPFNKLTFIDKLNEVLVQQIDPTYTMALYEALQMTTNWLLYDQIELLGSTSTDVKKQLIDLAYIKGQRLQMQKNTRDTEYQALLNTRAEKITRQRFPYYFNYTDRRVLFARFNRFSIDKLPKKEQAQVKLLLEKDLAAQHAILNNKCEHLQHLWDFQTSYTLAKAKYKTVSAYINYDSLDEDKMYSCKLCSYPIMCVHEVSFFDALQVAVDKDDRDDDKNYWIRQKIISQYKLVNQKRTGTEDTNSLFTYYCKYCGGELGKSDDVIQASLKPGTRFVNINDPNETTIHLAIASVLSINMNQDVIPIRKKILTNVIFQECRSPIIDFINKANKNERNNIDILIRYLAAVYTLSSLISINIHKLKSPSSILVYTKTSKPPEPEMTEPKTDSSVGGVQLKHELTTALKIIRNNTPLKRIGITDDKIKKMLLVAFRFMNRIFADETIVLKPSMPRDRLNLEIASSPLIAFATYMYRRDHHWRFDTDIYQLAGVDLDKLYPKKRDAAKLSTHALYTNLYNPKPKRLSDASKYIDESYKSIIEFLTQEPTNGVYTSVVNPRLSDFMYKHEAATRKHLLVKRMVPVRYLPVENGREYDFVLRNYQIAYCLVDDETVRFHRWDVTKSGTKLAYTCNYCKLSIDKASQDKNKIIEDKLNERMQLEAFFELYTLSCPIKDAHVFEDNRYTQCSATKHQLDIQDPKYYKKYLSTHERYRQSIVSDMIQDVSSIMKYATPVDKSVYRLVDTKIKIDAVVLESLANSLGKLYRLNDLQSIGMDATSGTRSLDIIESYVRLLYSHYTFVKNSSVDMHSHPDPSFFTFIKDNYFSNGKPKETKLAELPSFPTSTNPDQLLIDLFKILFDLIDKSNEDTNKLIKFIVKKIALQDSRRKEFNYAKLKVVRSNASDEDENAAVDDKEDENAAVDDKEDEEELDMFDGYDIEADDIEDNLDSFKD